MGRCSRIATRIFTLNNKGVLVLGKPGTFIAVEKRGGDPRKEGNLAFRKDISHRRLNLAASFGAGRDVTYQDESSIKGETVLVDPATEFSQTTLSDGLEIESVRPSFYTEDWVTIRGDNERLVVRTDRGAVLGTVIVDEQGLKYLAIREPDINLDLLKQPQSPIAGKYLPGALQE